MCLLLLLLQDLSEAGRVQAEFQAKVEKMMGQVIAADTTKEHYRQKVSKDSSAAMMRATCWVDC
jgi:hypothetical protein